mgnify:CR=1 FL=1
MELKMTTGEISEILKMLEDKNNSKLIPIGPNIMNTGRECFERDRREGKECLVYRFPAATEDNITEKKEEIRKAFNAIFRMFYGSQIYVNYDLKTMEYIVKVKEA